LQATQREYFNDGDPATQYLYITNSQTMRERNIPTGITKPWPKPPTRRQIPGGRLRPQRLD
jgi:hypothetical protein